MHVGCGDTLKLYVFGPWSLLTPQTLPALELTPGLLEKLKGRSWVDPLMFSVWLIEVIQTLLVHTQKLLNKPAFRL